MIHVRTLGLALIITLLATTPAHSQSAGTESPSVEEFVRDVYGMVSWTDGDTPNWEEVRKLFIPEAVVVLRYPPDLKVMSVDGFLLDWLRFQNQLADAGLTGFLETVLRAEAVEFGDIAHVHVVYESNIPGRDRPPRPGVDFWSLIRVDGRWMVTSVVNELPRDDMPIPDSFRR